MYNYTCFILSVQFLRRQISTLAKRANLLNNRSQISSTMLTVDAHGKFRRVPVAIITETS